MNNPESQEVYVAGFRVVGLKSDRNLLSFRLPVPHGSGASSYKTRAHKLLATREAINLRERCHPGASDGTPRKLDLGHAISMTRYAHGEIKISIYPQQAHKPPRRTVTAVRGSMSASNYVEQGAVRDRLVEHMLSPGSLDKRSKFQGLYSGWGKVRRLPRKKIFRPDARRQILECAAVAEEKYGKNCIMFTATVPGSGWRVAATVAKRSKDIVNRVKQIFRDNLKDDYALFGVWEWQKRGMLHLHIAVCSNDVEKMDRLKEAWKQRWINILLDISFEEKRDLFRKNASWTWQDDLAQVQCDASWVKHSVGQYLAKYICKEASERTKGKVFYPSKWTTVSRKIAAEARDKRVKGKRYGFDLGAVKSLLAGWLVNFREQTEKSFCFPNKLFPACGGVIIFADNDRSELLAHEFLISMADFSVMAARPKAA